MEAVLQPKNSDILVSRYQTTAQIAGAILRAIDESKPAADYLAPNFKSSNKIDSLKMIFLFVKKMIPYKREPSGRQTARTLQRIIADAPKIGGDCKHMATTAAVLCKSLNIPCKLRLISQTRGSKTPNHIYTVAVLNGTEYVLDGCLKSFGNEARYYYKFDIKC